MVLGIIHGGALRVASGGLFSLTPSAEEAFRQQRRSNDNHRTA
jgi:hypothetical protein